MTSRDFCYWLQGYFEVAQPDLLNKDKIELIQKHLNLVFVHEIDPSFPKEQQDKLNQIHGSKHGDVLLRC
jgi:hypothetical protein